MVMVFCYCDQARIEACGAPSALCQCNSSEPRMMVVRRYSNTPYIPRGMSHSLYLDVGTFSEGAASTQFQLDWLHLCWLLHFNRTDVLLPHEVGEERLETYPHLPEILWVSSDEEQCLSYLISLPVPTLAPPPHLEECTQTEGWLGCHPASTQTEGGLGCHPASTQTEGGLGYHPSLILLWEANQADPNWIMSSSRKYRSWLKGANIRRPNRPGGMQCGGHRWLTKLMPLFRRFCPRQVQWRPSS